MNKATQRKSSAKAIQIELPPHSIEIEQSILGRLLLDSRNWQEINCLITEADFYNYDHQLIYRAIGALADQGKPTDLFAIGDWLQEHKSLEDAGGLAYLGRIALDTPSAANAAWYARRVRLYSLKRQRLAALAQNDEDGVGTITAAIKELEAEGNNQQPKFIDVSELCELPPAESWLIKGYMATDSLCLLFGDPGCGKSFLAIDMACHIATGKPWRRQKTRQGRVVYIAGEGRNGLAKRFRAWFEQEGEIPQGIAICNTPAQLTDMGATTNLANKIRMMPEKPIMIVIDTINRNYGPGDENNTADMTRAVASLDILRNITGATILGVHHSGHAEKGRGRGSSVLLASVDCEFAIERFDRVVQMRCTKAKDFDHPPPLAWTLERQPLPWADEAGCPINSAVLLPNELQPDEHSIDARLGASQKRALEILQALQQRNRERRENSGFETANVGVAKQEWYEAMEKAGIPKNRRSDAKVDLERRKVILITDDHFVFITGEQMTRPWAEN